MNQPPEAVAACPRCDGKYESRGICVGITSRGETAEKRQLGRVRLRPNRGYPGVSSRNHDPMNQSSEAVVVLRDVITGNAREARVEDICAGITSHGETAVKPRFGRSLTLPGRLPGGSSRGVIP